LGRLLAGGLGGEWEAGVVEGRGEFKFCVRGPRLNGKNWAVPEQNIVKCYWSAWERVDGSQCDGMNASWHFKKSSWSLLDIDIDKALKLKVIF